MIASSHTWLSSVVVGVDGVLTEKIMSEGIKLFCAECGKQMIADGNIHEIQEYDRFTGQRKIVSRFIYYKCSDYDSGYSDRAWHVHEMIKYDIDTGNIEDVSYGSR